METQSVVLSKEYLDKIRGFAAIRPDEYFWYVPKCYRELPEDLRAKFKLRPVSGEDAAKLADVMRGEVEMNQASAVTTFKTKRGEFVVATCRKGVLGWENFYDDKGRIIPVQEPLTLENIPYRLLEELTDAIVGRASLTEEELLGLKS